MKELNNVEVQDVNGGVVFVPYLIVGAAAALIGFYDARKQA